MNELPLHPRLVHLPLGLGVALPLAAGAVGMLEARGTVSMESWWVVTGLQALLVGSTIGALRSGELARTKVKPLLPDGVLCRHRKASRVFFLTSLLTLAAMVASAFLVGKARTVGVLTSVVLGGLGLLLGARAGRTGGELVFTHGAAQAYVRSGG